MAEPRPPAGNLEAAACHQRGLDLLRDGHAARSLPEFERAVHLDSANAEFLKNLGNARKATGDLDGAAASYRRSLDIAADYSPSHYNLGLALHEMGQVEEAERHFRRVHELDPYDADALFHLGALLADRMRFSESAQSYRKALQLTPDNPYLWMGLGLACKGIPGRLEDSEQWLNKSVTLKPDLADAHYELGLVRWELGRIEEAVASYTRALELNSELHRAHNNIGNILQAEGRLDEAMTRYREAIRLSPDSAVTHSNLGNVMLRQGRLDDAAGCYLTAIRLQPGFSDAHLNLGSIHALKNEHDQAVACYASALQLQPASAVARECLLYEMQRICDWSRLQELDETLRRCALDQPDQKINPFSLLSIPSTPEEQLQCSKNFAKHLLHAVTRDRERLRFSFANRANPRLKVGYLSADFREHPVASLIVEAFELHDRSRFEILAYSYGPDDHSPMRARIERAFDRFVDVAPLSHADAASCIHADNVDILVDLTGYTHLARTEIAALRPAPVQVNFLGYPGTLGADFIDYIITDRFLTPPGYEAHYSEQPVYMPGSYQPNDRKRLVAATPPRSDLDLPEQSFVFCCLNHNYKMLPEVFAAWMRLLRSVPRGVLWLLKSNPWAEQNLCQEAKNHGVTPERLVFAPLWPRERHLGRLGAADLFLDTSPYNAHTTASDALWAGLPVLTCSGNTFASRVAGSLLTAVGMQELITRSMDEYEALALHLACNPGELAALRDKLARNRTTAPLFATPAFVRHLENAYLRMWENHLAGHPARAIEL